MLSTMPPLPENTSFKLDQDEFGQPRLRWEVPGLASGNHSRLAKALIRIALVIPWPAAALLPESALIFALITLVSWAWMSLAWILILILISLYIWENRGPHQLKGLTATFLLIAIVIVVPVAGLPPGFQPWDSFGRFWLEGWICLSTLWFLIGIMGTLATWNDPNREASLVLTEAWLLYDEGGYAPPGPPAQWDRWRLKAVQLEQTEQTEGRQRLLLDDGGYHHVEIGRSLSDADRQWLAGVIREWIVPPRLTQLSPESEGPAATPG